MTTQVSSDSLASYQKYVLVSADDWSGLYVDGEIDTYGVAYHAHDRIAELLGVDVLDEIEASDWLPDGRTPIKTLNEIHENFMTRKARLKRAAALRDNAGKLIAEAERLEKPE